MKIFEILKIAEANKEGFTLEIETLKEVSEGIAVDYLETQDSFDTKGLQNCINHAEKHDGFLGGWFNDENGKFYFDSIKIFPVDKLKEAIEFGKINKQIAVYHLTNREVIQL